MPRQLPSLFAMSLMMLAPVAAAQTSVTNGGDPIRQLFLDGKHQAVRIVRDLALIDPALTAEIHPWLREHGEALADDIERSALDFNDDHPAALACPATCACTHDYEDAPVHLSFNLCRGVVDAIDVAGRLLVHESVHHFGVDDEALADEIAKAVYASRQLQTWRPGSAWKKIAGGPGFAMKPTAVVTDDEIVVFNSDLLSGTSTSHAFDLVERVWRPGNGVQSSFNGAEALWTGEEILVFGGSLPMNDQYPHGWSYKDDLWTQLPEHNAPVFRAGHETVWTGSEMVVWGGMTWPATVSMPVFLGEGAAYDPKLKTWRTLPTLNAPSKRGGAASVWTGSEVLVFGGHGNGLALGESTGSLYDPEVNQWRVMSTVGAPTTAAARIAVWLGDRFVVFNCSAVFSPSFSGYVPSQDVWIPLALPPEAACSSLTLRNAVTMDHRLVIWDGGNGGFLYDRILDQWSVLPPDTLPSDFYLVSGTWRGGELYFFGHATSDGRPITGVWRP